MDRTGLLDAARVCGIRRAESIAQLARPAAILRPQDAGSASPSQSRIGGLPALPAGLDWPQWKGQSLVFIAQVDLAAQPRALADDGFPTDGLLLFFYDAEQRTWGCEPGDAGSFVVIHLDASRSAAPREWPSDLPEEARYEPVPLVAEETLLLPPWESVLIEDLGLGDEQYVAYNAVSDLADHTSPKREWSSRCLLGGYPDQIQGDMTRECADVAGDAREWRLLFQVPSDIAGMMWGDCGCLYYMIPDEALRARQFDRSWMILQCS